MDHFSKYKLQENVSDDEGDGQQQQKQQIQQLPLEMGSNNTAAKVGGLYLETCTSKEFFIVSTSKAHIINCTATS